MQAGDEIIGYDEVERRAKDIKDTVAHFDMKENWEVILDKYRLLVAQFNKLEEEMKEETKMITLHPLAVDWEGHAPEWIPNMLSVYTNDEKVMSDQTSANREMEQLKIVDKEGRIESAQLRKLLLRHNDRCSIIQDDYEKLANQFKQKSESLIPQHYISEDNELKQMRNRTNDLLPSLFTGAKIIPKAEQGPEGIKKVRKSKPRSHYIPPKANIKSVTGQSLDQFTPAFYNNQQHTKQEANPSTAPQAGPLKQAIRRPSTTQDIDQARVQQPITGNATISPKQNNVNNNGNLNGRPQSPFRNTPSPSTLTPTTVMMGNQTVPPAGVARPITGNQFANMPANNNPVPRRMKTSTPTNANGAAHQFQSIQQSNLIDLTGGPQTNTPQPTPQPTFQPGVNPQRPPFIQNTALRMSTNQQPSTFVPNPMQNRGVPGNGQPMNPNMQMFQQQQQYPLQMPRMPTLPATQYQGFYNARSNVQVPYNMLGRGTSAYPMQQIPNPGQQQPNPQQQQKANKKM
ncbi:calcium-binding protein [Acrasis kona]|uniref:Calcium-binding protein n=1 Tax=Acrasis kona TaxID=1008807 RepID=A0AAW2ZJ63_9EUKA